MHKPDVLSSLATDPEIIAKITAGEKDYFEILIRRYNSVLYKIGRSYGLPHDDVQDLMQEAHISAFLNLNKFEERSSYKTWLIRIMLNKFSRTNIALDYAWGTQGSRGFFVNLGEVF